MSAPLLSFPPYSLDVENACLWQGKKRIDLMPRDFAILHHLVSHSERLVTHKELLSAVWTDTVVSPGVLKVCIRRIRRILQDGADAPRFIETRHRQGYRFLAKVVSSQAEEKPKASVAPGTQFSAVSPPHSLLVGREAEFEQLQGKLEKALHGERQIVFVTGEPGIGKTTLIRAFLRQVATRKVAAIGRGQCVETYGAGEAYLPILEALGRLCQAPEGEPLVEWLRQHAPTWLMQLPTLLTTSEAEALQQKLQGATQARMLQEMLAAVETLTPGHPLVLSIEDLQWSDYSTLDLLAILARGHEPARLLIIGTYRLGEMLSNGHRLRKVVRELYAHQQASEVALGLLNASHIGEYVQQRFPHNTFPATFAPVLHQRTEGNPLFLTNVLEDWVSRGVLIHDEESWKLQANFEAVVSEIPNTIRHLITTQSEQLLPEERRVLEVASLTGIEFSSAAVAAAQQTEVLEVEEWCAGLASRQQFLRPAGVSRWPDGTMAERYGFLHALYQQFWHERVRLGQRQRYHLRIGERQEAAYGERAGEIAAELAIHFEEGRDYPRAVRYRSQAAENAIQRYASQEAVVHLTKGLELLNHHPDTPERTQQEFALRATLGISLQTIQGYGNPVVEAAYTRAQELSRQIGEPAQLFLVLYGLWMFHLSRAEHNTAHDLGEQLLSLAHRTHDSGLLIEAHATVGVTLVYLGELQRARTELEATLTLYDPQQHRGLAFVYGQDPRIACGGYLSQVTWLLGYPDRARQRSEETLRYAQDFAHPISQAYALNECALFYQLVHNTSVVQRLAEELLAFSQQHKFSFWELAAVSLQAWLLTEQGQPATSIAQLRQGSSVRKATGTALRLPYYQGCLAEAYGKNNQPEEGITLVERALAVIASTGERWWEAEIYRLKGELTLQKGTRDSGLGTSSPSPQAPSLKPQDPREVAQEAEGFFLKAIDIARTQSAKSLELRATMSLVRLRQQQGKKKKAREMLAAIYGWFTEGFDTKDLQEAKGLLETLA